MGRVIFVTGFKGGVGKTTVAANVASALYALGSRVLVIDGDFGMRCMDMVLGLESDILFDGSDVLSGRCSAGAAMAEVKARNGFSFIPAPMNLSEDNLQKDSFSDMIESVRADFDFIIIDSCAEMTDYYRSFAATADEAIIVTLHQSTSVRAAEKTAARLSAMGIPELSLVVNGYRDKEASAGKLPDIASLIERSSVKLIGVVPFDGNMPASQEASELAFTGDMRKKASGSETAFLNIAERLRGKRVPLYENVRKPIRRSNYEGIICRKTNGGKSDA
ncbi:MAG: AAA family ATPase [Clostridiales bacterium]|nr:AAA family ATPase [Candidatus Coliplasma equi]